MSLGAKASLSSGDDSRACRRHFGGGRVESRTVVVKVEGIPEGWKRGGMARKYGGKQGKSIGKWGKITRSLLLFLYMCFTLTGHENTDRPFYCKEVSKYMEYFVTGG